MVGTSVMYLFKSLLFIIKIIFKWFLVAFRVVLLVILKAVDKIYRMYFDEDISGSCHEDVDALTENDKGISIDTEYETIEISDNPRDIIDIEEYIMVPDSIPEDRKALFKFIKSRLNSVEREENKNKIKERISKDNHKELKISKEELIIQGQELRAKVSENVFHFSLLASSGVLGFFDAVSELLTLKGSNKVEQEI